MGGGKLQLMGADGAVLGGYANAGTWLTGLERALKDAGGPEPALKIWEGNSDLFQRIHGQARERDKAMAKRCDDVGLLSIRLTTPPQAEQQQGDMLAGAQ